jgi:hypothetical protein
MFQFAGLPPAPYVFRYGYRRITSGEFPHSEIPGSQNGQLLPRAYRSRPRPSSALGAKASTVCPCSLDQKNTGIDVAMEFSRSARATSQLARAPSPSKLNSVRPYRRGRRDFQASRLTGRPKSSTGPAPAGVRAPAFPRKEVIQPQLPLRLPCYDFTPIIDPTFDGSLPCGLGHRLRVLPTFVV